MVVDDDSADFLFTSSVLHVVQEILLVFVMAAAIILNSSVVFVICRNKHLRKRTTNIFILNLVISNMLMAVLVMPLSLAALVRLRWNLNTLLCRVSSFLRRFFPSMIINSVRRVELVSKCFTRNWCTICK